MERSWQAQRAGDAATRLHRAATTLVVVLSVISAFAFAGGVAIVITGDDVQLGVTLGVSGLVSLLPIFLLGYAAQTYACDLLNRLERDERADAVAAAAAAAEAEAEPIVEAVRRRPRAGRTVAGY